MLFCPLAKVCTAPSTARNSLPFSLRALTISCWLATTALTISSVCRFSSDFSALDGVVPYSPGLLLRLQGPIRALNVHSGSSCTGVENRLRQIVGLCLGGQIFPRMYMVVLVSARRLPTIFAKNAADRPKNGSGTIGTKTILGEMAT